MNRQYTIALALICAIAGIGGPAAPNAGAMTGNLGSILPLGDSITYGGGAAGGYRDPLYTRLHNAGDTFTFVGTETANSTTILNNAGQSHHGGYSGYFIEGQAITGVATPNGKPGLYEGLGTSIGPFNPDIILLMIGTNDIGYGYAAPNTAATRLTALINHIYDFQPKASLFLASITPRTSGYNGLSGDDLNALAQTYNAAMPGIVNGQRALGRKVFFVDMYNAIDKNTDLSDGVHPNASGYNKMAQTWYNAVSTAHTPEPSTIVLLVMALAGLLAYAWKKRK